MNANHRKNIEDICRKLDGLTQSIEDTKAEEDEAVEHLKKNARAKQKARQIVGYLEEAQGHISEAIASLEASVR